MSASPTEIIAACSLGRVAYGPAWALQKELQAQLIERKQRAARQRHPATEHQSSPQAPSMPPHMLLLLEHPPVYTLGKSGDADHLLLSEERLRARGASFHRIDRGGDITFHGPGQLVGYPILDLDRFFTDIHRYLRTLEEVIIQTLADYDVEGRRIDGRTGVWVGPDARGLERKVCAMGIRCSRWVTMHGFALNLNTDLSYFSHIVPCGIADRGVTSLAEELGQAVDEKDVEERLLAHFGNAFGADIQRYGGADADAFLEASMPV